MNGASRFLGGIALILGALLLVPDAVSSVGGRAWVLLAPSSLDSPPSPTSGRLQLTSYPALYPGVWVTRVPGYGYRVYPRISRYTARRLQQRYYRGHGSYGYTLGRGYRAPYRSVPRVRYYGYPRYQHAYALPHRAVAYYGRPLYRRPYSVAHYRGYGGGYRGRTYPRRSYGRRYSYRPVSFYGGARRYVRYR